MAAQNQHSPTSLTHENSQNGTMRKMSKDVQLLATLVATATYVMGFNPPGGVWQETGDAAAHLPGDPIMLSADYRRYIVFFYCNTTAFATSLMVFVLLIVLTARRKKENHKIIVLASSLMVFGLLSFIGAYGAGTCRDTFSLVYYSLLVAAGLITHVVLQLQEARDDRDSSAEQDKPSRQVLMLFATFALTVTYVSGLCTPGGFWDNTEGGHRPGDAIRKDHHAGRLTAFFICSTTAFVASLLTIMVLLNRKVRRRTAFSCSIVALIGLYGAYAFGIRRETQNYIRYSVLLYAAMLLYVTVHVLLMVVIRPNCSWTKLKDFHNLVSRWWRTVTQTPAAQVNDLRQEVDEVNRTRQIRRASSLVQLLATLAVTITYQGGLDPPGGLWQDNGDGHMAGDPILLTTNPRRYMAFFYCNSVAFVASLIAIILVQEELLLEHYAVEAAMMLELLGLVGAYATGSCRDASSSIYVMGIAGAAVVYVVLHVSDFALDNTGNYSAEDDDLVDRMGRRLLLFAILVANITYQAGLTPPGGFLLQDDEFGHHVGDPVLLYNYPRRYKAYFYCNSISFMLSIAQILVLVNPVLYKPAVRSHALSICTAVSFICLMGAFAAGSTQHLKTSIYIFVLLVVVFLVVVLLLLAYLVVSLQRVNTADESSDGVTIQEERVHEGKKRIGARRKHLMTLGILVASVTYQAGLDPPGGSWQRSKDGHDAGTPVMRDNMRHRYLTFFYSNTMSFVASILLIAFVLPLQNERLPTRLHRTYSAPAQLEHEGLLNRLLLQCKMWLPRVINAFVVLDFLGILVAYAAGSSRQWKTSVNVGTLVIVVLAYVAIRVTIRVILSSFRKRLRNRPRSNSSEG